MALVTPTELTPFDYGNYRLVGAEVYPGWDIFSGPAEKVGIRFRAGPEGIVPPPKAQVILDWIRTQLPAAGGQPLAGLVWVDTTPTLWSDYYVEIYDARLVPWGIILGALLILIGATLITFAVTAVIWGPEKAKQFVTNMVATIAEVTTAAVGAVVGGAIRGLVVGLGKGLGNLTPVVLAGGGLAAYAVFRRLPVK